MSVDDEAIPLWHEHRWGGKPDVVVAAKLCEEAGECVGAAIKREEGRRGTDDVLDELGDVLIVCSVLAARLGTTIEEARARRFESVRLR